MWEKIRFYRLVLFIIFVELTNFGILNAQGSNLYWIDSPFIQDYSIKYDFTQTGVLLKKVAVDRNGKIQVLSSIGLLHPHNGMFLYPGTLEPDKTYRPMSDKNIVDLAAYENQLVYLDDKAVLSNAWAGKLFLKHGMPNAKLFAGGEKITFLVAEDKELKLLNDSEQLWKGKTLDSVIALKFIPATGKFWILTSTSLCTFSPLENELKTLFKGNGFTSFDVMSCGSRTIIGTSNGYIEINNLTQEQVGEIRTKVPVPEITVVKEVNGNIWFGSLQGAYMLRADGKFNYYYGERWLVSNRVIDIAEGPDNSVLILTEKGLSQICFKEITLHEKALYFENQVRRRHIRYGLNATLNGLVNGNLSTGYLADSDNDGLWTSMYLGSQVFRYAVTKSKEALQNCIESLDAMERLYTIHTIPGFPARSFERSGHIDVLSDPERWQHSPDSAWVWKATTSSDEAIGHVFAFGVIAELMDVDSVRDKAIRLLDELMQHIVNNNFYLIDYDGKPTLWGKWNPEYVNGFPTSVGDRKLYSSNIVAMLQTAYHFTRKEIYREKAFELMYEHGYLENLMRPMREIGKAPENASEWAKMLSESWNHSDDEMYFLGYWGLYRYAFNDTLRAMYKKAIVDHWQYERPEKDGLWNLFTGMVSDEFDLEEAIGYLQEHPLDLIQWEIKNSHRKDIEFLGPNFRNQTIAEVLPPDERPVQRHNANMFRLDREGGNGNSELSSGDIWLLPYWLGRFLGIIRE